MTEGNDKEMAAIQQRLNNIEKDYIELRAGQAGHELLCAERYKGIATAHAEMKKDVGEVKDGIGSLNKSIRSGLVGLLVIGLGMIGWLAVEVYNNTQDRITQTQFQTWHKDKFGEEPKLPPKPKGVP